MLVSRGAYIRGGLYLGGGAYIRDFTVFLLPALAIHLMSVNRKTNEFEVSLLACKYGSLSRYPEFKFL